MSKTSFSLSGGDSNGTQYSPGAVEPLDGAVSFLNWISSIQSCGIAVDGAWKVVYLTFGLEGVSNYEMAKTLVSRAEQFFQKPSSVSFSVEMPGLKIFPNPADEELSVYFSGMAPQDVTLTLFDQNGRLIGSRSLHPAGNTLQLALSQLAFEGTLSAGIYILDISEGKQTYRHKLIKL